MKDAEPTAALLKVEELGIADAKQGATKDSDEGQRILGIGQRAQ